MNRREFLKGAVAGGALMAASGADVRAEDNPNVFPRRGVWERLSVNYVRIAAGAEKPFSVFHISDTHLTNAYGSEGLVKAKLSRMRTQTFGGRQEEALRDSIAWAREHADCLLHTGDLVDFQSEANFDVVRESLFNANRAGQGGIRLLTVGNHEYYQEMWLGDKCTDDDAWRRKTSAPLTNVRPCDLSFQVETVNGVRFVLMDDVFGTVSAAQVERFHEEARSGLPIVLCMHVPFFTDAIWQAHETYWRHTVRFASSAIPPARGDCARQYNDQTTQAFLAYLRKEPLLKAILAGHLHLGVQDDFSPTAREFVVGGNFLFHGQHVLIV